MNITINGYYFQHELFPFFAKSKNLLRWQFFFFLGLKRQYNQLTVLEECCLPTSIALFTLFRISPIADSHPGAVLGVWGEYCDDRSFPEEA